MSFDLTWAKTHAIEGGYSNNPNDPGGATNHGITERVARANGWKGDMKDLPFDTAKQIAKSQYWDILNLDKIDALSPAIAGEMFDTLYNGGEPGQWLQRCLNVFNRGASIYPDMKVDGRIGALTVEALKTLLAKRGKDGERVMLAALNSLQGERFIRLGEANAKLEDFEFGWFLNRIIDP